jgi:hypothetical protein
MLYPQGNFYPQGAFSQQSFQNPQGNFYPQGALGQQGFQGNAFHSNPFQSNLGIQGNLGNIPFANTPYGYPQQTQAGYAQHPTQQQAALQQHAIQQLLAHQLAAQQLGAQQFGPQQPFGAQQPSPMNAFPGLSNGAAQSGAWTQQQPGTEQINPTLAPRHHLLQQLAQYHYLVAQQLAQLAAQQAAQCFGVRGADIDRAGVVWVSLASGHLGEFDRRKCKGPLNGPTATGDHCPEGWRFHRLPGPGFVNVPQMSVESSYYTWVDQHDTLGLGANVPIATGNLFDGVHALVDGKFITLRIPYPLGFYAKGLEDRI